MELYFRIKDNGATVYRVDDQNPQRRLELNPIADAIVHNGRIKPRQGADLTAAETYEIETWLKSRAAALEARAAAEAEETIETLNQTANWFAAKPGPEANPLADRLLMAMHDLRTAIVRYKSEL